MKIGKSVYHPDDNIGPYTLIRSLGRGTFGEVWLAQRRTSLLTTQVAIKLPLDRQPDLALVRAEAQVWLRASGHPNIIPVLEAEVYDGQVVVASEYVAGGSLADWLQRHDGKAPSVEAAAGMLRGILTGLEHLHTNQLIHRDLKPGNVLVQSGIPRLADFGLTRLLNATEQTTDMAGTPAYMAPEAFTGNYSAASDVWAAGVLLYEMLTGTLPYPQTDLYAVLLAVTGSDRPHALPDSLPSALRAVVMKAIAKSPADRFASASEMHLALDAAMSPDLGMPGQAPLHNLAAQPTSFIGREKELFDVAGLLSRSRLLTLIGSGGCGKTRLMLQAARKVTEYPDGIWLTELAALTDPALVARAVARSLNITEVPDQPLLQTLATELKHKKLLIALDNCEHLLPVCAELSDTLLRACPGVDMLATSREALGIGGEVVYRVPSLSLPDSGPCHTPESLARFESVRLFVERASAVAADFVVTPLNAQALAVVCQRLDGIPLAIELAAVRMRSLALEQIASRLDDRFRLLTGGSRTALPRQQTLRALIDWSYSLLSDAEKMLLCRLSVFGGGWTLEAAQDICASAASIAVTGGPTAARNAQLDTPAMDVLDLLTCLVDKSLVVAEQHGKAVRYQLLETIRQYARDRMMDLHDADGLRARHLDFYLKLAETTGLQLLQHNQAEVLAALETEHDNLRAALAWCTGTRDFESRLRLAGALWRFWSIRGHLAEGGRALAEALEAVPISHPELGRSAVRARALSGAGSLAHDRGDCVRAVQLLQESVALWREHADPYGLATALNLLANVVLDGDDYETARGLYEEALALWRELGDARGQAMVLSNLGALAQDAGDPDRAVELLKESVRLKRVLGNAYGLATSLDTQGNVERRRGDTEQALTLYEEALGIRRTLGHKQGTAMSLCNMGSALLERGEVGGASKCLLESLDLFEELEDVRGSLECLSNLADVAGASGRHRDAAHLRGSVSSLRCAEKLMPSAEEAESEERAQEAAQAALGLEGFARAVATGRNLTLERAREFTRETSRMA